MYNKKPKLPFVALSDKLYSTGRKSPAFEFERRASTMKFICSITKKKYRFSEYLKWWQSPEVQIYAKQGYELWIQTKTQEPFQQPKYGENLEQILCFRMKKPFDRRPSVAGFKQVGTAMGVTPQQSFAPDHAQTATQQDMKELDDKIPMPREAGDEDEWNNQF